MDSATDWVYSIGNMLGIGSFIRRYRDPLQAQRDLMEHYAARRQVRSRWDRRYAHMRFVIRWAPIFRRHILAARQAHDSEAA